MTKFKKIYSPIIVIMLLVVLPLGSYYYLYSGFDYFKDNMVMLEKKGALKDFKFLKKNGDPISKDSLFGYASVISFLETDCGSSCKEQLKQLERVQEQFYKTGRVKINTVGIIPVSENPQPPAKSDLGVTLREKTWNLIYAQSDQNETFMWDISPSRDEKIKFNQFVLIDDSLNVRSYYDANDTESVNLMIRHIAMIMPKKKKSAIILERDKEK